MIRKAGNSSDFNTVLTMKKIIDITPQKICAKYKPAEV